MEMKEMANDPIGILSTGSCPGEFLQTNEELAATVMNYRSGTGRSLDSWIRDHYGILTRARTRRLPSEMAIDACLSAIRLADADVHDIDFLVLNTVSGDYRQPNTATSVQQRMGMRNDSFAFEINMPCAGSVYGIAVARSMIASGLGDKALVVGVDKMSAIVDAHDFFTAGMFGDGAGACLVGRNPAMTVRDVVLHSRHDADLALSMPSSGSAEVLTTESVSKKRHYLRQQGAATSAFIIESLGGVVQEIMARNGLDSADIRRVIPHQASRRLVLEALSASGIHPEQVELTVDRLGNTSSASLLITLDQYVRSPNRKPGPVVMAGMGAGLNWGGLLLIDPS